jgi:hypothetical protein
VIRHVVLARFKPGVTDDQVDAFVTAMRAVRVDGLRSLTCGRTAALRPGGWDYALVADLDDEDAYLRYDNDAAHTPDATSGDVPHERKRHQQGGVRRAVERFRLRVAKQINRLGNS